LSQIQAKVAFSNSRRTVKARDIRVDDAGN
jgi:hypothetical protein